MGLREGRVPMDLMGSEFVLRPWRHGDEASLVTHADNWNIWINLTDAFPHPYTDGHARRWIGLCQDEPRRSTQFAIEIDGCAVGGIGFEVGMGIRRRTAVIGYWLGEAYWGRGIATEALRLVSGYAFDHFEIARLQAEVLQWNPASVRVLEKAGYILEGRLRKCCVKNGEVIDDLVYALLK
jgi:RimJ/RimL family protein N-acetyltransferase